MVRCMRVLLITVLALSLGSCATAKFGKKFTSQQVATIQKCRHTRPQLVAYFGEPMREGVQDGYVTLTWQWADMKLGAFDSTEESIRKQQQGQGMLVGFFNAKDVLVDYAYNPVSFPRPNDHCK